MYKLFTALSLFIILGSGVFAQTTPRADFGDRTNNLFGKDPKDLKAVSPVPSPTSTNSVDTEDYKKNEFYLGYSNQQIDNFGRTTFQGVQGAYVRNVSRWFGIRADLSYARNSQTLRGNLVNPAGGTYDFQQDLRRSLANFLGGVQIKDNASTSRFKPFAFALGGVAVSRTTLKNLSCASANCPTTIPIINNNTFTDTSLAGSFGGGLDIRVNRRVDFRAFQIDYNPIFTGGRVDNNFRIGIGFVFR